MLNDLVVTELSMEGDCINFVMPAAVAASHKKAALANTTHALQSPAHVIDSTANITFGVMVYNSLSLSLSMLTLFIYIRLA